MLGLNDKSVAAESNAVNNIKYLFNFKFYRFTSLDLNILTGLDYLNPRLQSSSSVFSVRTPTQNTDLARAVVCACEHFSSTQ